MEQNRPLTLGSLFDGSGGFPLGGLLSGIIPVWASEIEPFPIRVTTKRLPFMKHYGNVSTMNGAELEPVDIITFGSPCQDMSIAGKRSGLDGNRSSLFYEAIRIITEMRCATNGKYPRYIVWENVPGAFSSNSGQDFKAVLEAVIGIAEPGTQVPDPPKNRWPGCDLYMGDNWSVAYRVLDAQWWGVAQRRKRVYLVGSLTDRSAGKILFESEGLSGYSTAGFRAWQAASRGASACVGATGYDGYNGSVTGQVSATLGVNCGMSTGRNGIVLNDQGGNRMDITEDVTCTLRAESHHPPCVLDALPLENHPTDGRIKIQEDGTVQTLTSRMGTGGMNVPLLLKIRSGCEGGGKGALIQEDRSATISCNNDQTLFDPKSYGVCSKDSNAMKSENPLSGFYEAQTARTLDGNGGNPSCNQGGIAVVESIPFTQNQRNEVRILGDKAGAICQAFTKQQTYVLQGSMIGRAEENGPQGDGINEDVCFTLNTADRHAVYAVTTGNYMQTIEEQAPTLMARDYKDPTVVCNPISFYPQMKAECQSPRENVANTLVNGTNPGFQNGVIENGYTVRRLTPTECARLQGFPDWWCDNLETPEPTPEDIRFWADVFETHRKICGTATKPKSERQIVKWLQSPHSDAAEYKMWGNGVALPCVIFVLSGIVWSTQSEVV